MHGAGARPILVGFGDAPSVGEAVASLRRAGHEVVAFRRAGRRAPRGALSVGITAPERDARRAVADLVGVARDLRAAAVLPLDEAAVWLAGAASPLLDAVVAGPTGRLVDLALDRRVQLTGAELAGLCVPPTVTCRTRDDLRRLEPGTLVLRPALDVHEHDGRIKRPQTHRCSGSGALLALARAWDERVPLLVQPVVRGRAEEVAGVVTRTGFGLWAAHAPAAGGRLRGRSRAVAAPDGRAVEGCEALLGATAWRGAFSVEFVRDADGRLWFVRLAGRCTQRLALLRRRGLDHPAAAVADVLDRALPAA